MATVTGKKTIIKIIMKNKNKCNIYKIKNYICAQINVNINILSSLKLFKNLVRFFYR